MENVDYTYHNGRLYGKNGEDVLLQFVPNPDRRLGDFTIVVTDYIKRSHNITNLDRDYHILIEFGNRPLILFRDGNVHLEPKRSRKSRIDRLNEGVSMIRSEGLSQIEKAIQEQPDNLELIAFLQDFYSID